MKSKVDPAFWRQFNALPSPVQRLARRSFLIWLDDPFYPSLRFKELRHDLWSVRIGDHYRATGYFLHPTLSSGFGSERMRNTTNCKGPWYCHVL